MNASIEYKTHVRAEIACRTRSIHEALYQDPALKRLTRPDITQSEYNQAMRILCSFYQSVEQERQRFNTWNEFALTRECEALSSDLRGHPSMPVKLVLADKFEVLGGLYVAHGASFGRSLFRRNVEEFLPEMPQSFVGQRTAKNTWRLLLDCMERYGQNRKHMDALLNGASQSFEIVVRASQIYRSSA